MTPQHCRHLYGGWGGSLLIRVFAPVRRVRHIDTGNFRCEDVEFTRVVALPNSTEWSGIWEVLGCKWTFHILRLLVREDAQFNQIKNSIEGLPASTLSTRLKSLQKEDVVVRSVNEAATPPTVSYSLTAKGDELAEIITQIEELEQRYENG